MRPAAQGHRLCICSPGPLELLELQVFVTVYKCSGPFCFPPRGLWNGCNCRFSQRCTSAGAPERCVARIYVFCKDSKGSGLIPWFLFVFREAGPWATPAWSRTSGFPRDCSGGGTCSSGARKGHLLNGFNAGFNSF